MAKQLSAQQTKRASVKALIAWYKLLGNQGCADYIRQGQLNRTLIAKELVFARSAWGSNGRLLWALKGIESRLRKAGVLDSTEAPKTKSMPKRDRELTQRNRDASRLATLEKQNAALQAKVDAAHKKLRDLNVFEQFLADTGRAAR